VPGGIPMENLSALSTHRDTTMRSKSNFRLRKTTDIDREYATIELLADDVAILDTGFSDNGIFEIAFNESIGGVIIDWVELREWIEKAKDLAELDRS